MSSRHKQDYHHHVISIMAPRPSPLGSSNARAPSSSRSNIIKVHQLDHGLHHKVQRLKAITKGYIINKEAPYHQPSLRKHHGLHHIIKVLMGQQRTIINNQGSNHRTVTTARVTIRRAIHDCCWHQGQSSICCWHQ